MARVFLSCVSGEFKEYRELLAQQLAAAGVGVGTQEHFADTGRPVLELLDQEVALCDVAVHLVGLGTGYKPKSRTDGRAGEVDEFLARRDRAEFLRTSGLQPHERLLPQLSYTQWEYWLARRHRKKCLVYKVDDAAPREGTFCRQAAEAAEQAAHLDRIRDTFDGRAGVSGPWHLATRVMVSLIHGGTVAVADAVDQPTIVLGFDRGPVSYQSRAAFRWRGVTVPLAERAALPTGRGWAKAVAARLTDLIDRGNRAFAHENVGVSKVVVELVLPEELITRPLGEWVFFHEHLRRQVAVNDWHPVRVRLAGRRPDGPDAHEIRSRLKLLQHHQDRVERVCREVPLEFRTAASARPLAVVHAGGPGRWHPTAVVCGGFPGPPPAPRARRVNRPAKAPTESEHLLAVFHGVPFVVWADHSRPVDADTLETDLNKVPRPADLCEFFQGEPYVVVAEAPAPPFPEEAEMRSDVSPLGAAT